ncbi:MAG: bifunctional pyr operon transcriptional regulator/uracil phosphoribosyltransferase PyrR [Oscillospiraceae bacterium]|nr:bifunctional pyr operon transcriptional regulator/uracil phosphoribosyltransferase PyrR [Oscillospiraceae bacterium]MBQ5990743.1 bifunctional pyr operon transcriptional regulator/uracil phosphoribosyltransferase PyrR [Oscillospiraceae bacterium]MBR6923533.1 bifunctional pyr operon transcriptional regulator/uracil phosphoribosyltransferase PyrR [Oscillospiraceae bacterium]
MKKKAVILDENAINRAVTRITYEILEQNRGAENLCIIGILSRGAFLAERIAKKINEIEGISVECGQLDITPYRDDKRQIPEADRTKIEFDIGDKVVILVDDVIYTGRSARAAIDAVIKRGRPQRIQLAVLIDRGHREIPIRPDFIGKNLPTSREERVRVQVTEIDECDSVTIFEPEE